MSGAKGLDVTMAPALSPKKDPGLPQTSSGDVPVKEFVIERASLQRGASGLSIRKAGLSELRPQPWSHHRESSRPQAASSKTLQGLWDSPMIKSKPHFSLAEGRAIINLESNKYQSLAKHFPASSS